MRYAAPGTQDALVTLQARYGNYIGGEFVAPVKGQYFTNTSPVNGSVIGEFPRSDAADIERALDAAHAAADAWGRTSVQERSLILLKIADRIEQNLEKLAVAETWDNGKAGARDAQRRRAPRRRPLPLFRRLHPRPGRHCRRNQRHHRQLPLP
ncbi:hypothetical protein Q3H58_002526 [Pseudomonas psychrotolerans]|nr:hypothetical protein [Pseudomonas psychrotolerans]